MKKRIAEGSIDNSLSLSVPKILLKFIFKTNLGFEMKFRIRKFSGWNSERFSETNAMFFCMQNTIYYGGYTFYSQAKNKCETFGPFRKAGYWISQLSLEFEKHSEWKQDSRFFFRIWIGFWKQNSEDRSFGQDNLYPWLFIPNFE